MGRTRRLGGLLALSASATAAFVMTSAAPARADDTVSVKPKVLQSNWYWYRQAQTAEGTGLEGLPEPSGVPAGDLAVAYTPNGTPRDPNEPSKETFLAFDLSGWPRGATVSSFSFTLKVDGAAQLAAGQPALIACLPQGLWSNGVGTSYVEKPAVDCSSTISSAGKYDAATTSYTFSIPAMAQQWVTDVNTGVSIRQAAPESGPTQPFQLTFTGPNTVTASGSYTVAAPVTDVVPAQPNPQPGIQADPGSNAGSSGGLASTGGLGAAPATGTGDVAPPVVAPTPQLAPAPTAAMPAFGRAGSAPSLGFWLFGLALLVLLTLVSLVLGDLAAAPAAASAGPTRRGSRLDRALRTRRLSSNPSLTLEPR